MDMGWGHRYRMGHGYGMGPPHRADPGGAAADGGSTLIESSLGQNPMGEKGGGEAAPVWPPHCRPIYCTSRKGKKPKTPQKEKNKQKKNRIPPPQTKTPPQHRSP